MTYQTPAHARARAGGGEGPAAAPETGSAAAAGPYRPLTRLEIAAAVPAGSRRARRQTDFLNTLGADPELAQLRADRLRNIAEVARILARYASWVDRTTRPTRQRICRLAGIGLSTWKTCRRWLQEHGYLGIVRQGRTALLMAAVLSALADGDGRDAPNEAAVYVLCVPQRKPRLEPPVQARPVSRPLSGSRRETDLSLARGRDFTPVQPLRKGPGSKLTDEHVAAIARPFLQAGWTAADLRHALEYRPDGRPHRARLDNVFAPARWLAWRLSRWTTEPDICWQAFRELGRWPRLPSVVPARSPSMRQWDQVAPEGQVYLARNRAKAAAAAAARVDVRAHADSIRRQMGWLRSTPPEGST